ncbi:SH3 domain-containing protein [Streptomyces sp. NPDC004266]|uniref:SH3 domain-containing protein n=1 Tax=Streptomyces sp. NPDC004266 TaxID=3364693 RepID=UPI0036B45BF9
MSVELASLRVAESEARRGAFAPQGEDIMTTRYEVAPGYRVNVRSGPSTKYPVVRTLPLGATVAIHCQKYGEWVSGPYGTTNIWDNIAPGEYVSDAYVHTGSDDMVAPRCP